MVRRTGKHVEETHYASYAAGEILAMLKNARYRYSHLEEIDAIEGDILKVLSA